MQQILPSKVHIFLNPNFSLVLASLPILNLVWFSVIDTPELLSCFFFEKAFILSLHQKTLQ